jgi:hypothetical protein
VVIRDILVQSPEIAYELRDGTNNLTRSGETRLREARGAMRRRRGRAVEAPEGAT